MILCRNLVFTYFEETLQREVALSLQERLLPGGVLVLGRHEALPAGIRGFTPVKSGLPIYRRSAV